MRSKYVLYWQTVIDDSIFQHIDVQCDVESTCTHWRELAEHNVFCDAVAIVLFTDSRCFHQNLHRFLERATH